MYIKPNVSKVDPSEKGAANGIATLDSSGIVPSTQLPTLGTASAKDVPTSGNASTTQVVMGDDTRLTDSRNAADVSDWAKASTKPTYSYSEITDKPTLGTIASHGFTAISYSSWINLKNKDTEYTLVSEWNPPAAGYMVLFAELTFNSSGRPSYLRVERYTTAASYSQWTPVGILELESNSGIGIASLKLPIIDSVSTTDKFRVIGKQSQGTFSSGQNQVILSGFIIS